MRTYDQIIYFLHTGIFNPRTNNNLKKKKKEKNAKDLIVSKTIN